MKRILAAFLLVFLTMTLTARVPKVYYVSLATNVPAGDNSADGLTLSTPFATIQHCADVMAAGDSCEVRGGTYNQSSFLLIGTGHTANGTNFSSGQILLEAYNGEHVILTHNSDTSIMVLGNTHNPLYWHFKNLDFDGSTGFYIGSGTSGQLIGGDADYVWIENCRVHHGVNVGLGPDGYFWTLTNVESDHNGTVPNVVEGTQYHGVYAGGQYMDIAGGSYHENSGSGIQIFASGSNSVSFNTVHGAAIWGNDTYDANCGCSELSMSNGEGNGAYNNWIDRIAIAGIQVDNRCGLFGAPCYVYNNTVTSSSKVGVKTGSTTLGVIIQGNILYVPGGTTVSDLGASTIEDHNLKNIDPSFTNASIHDYTLQGGSAALACGISVASTGIAGLLTDFLGVARPPNSAAACGAYQSPAYSPTTTLAGEHFRFRR